MAHSSLREACKTHGTGASHCFCPGSVIVGQSEHLGVNPVMHVITCRGSASVGASAQAHSGAIAGQSPGNL